MQSKPLQLKFTRACYLESKNTYYLRAGDTWVKNDRTMIMKALARDGITEATEEEESLSEMDHALLHLSEKQYVQYAGRVAGYEAGLYEMCGQRVLVTQPSAPVLPIPGNWPLLDQMFTELLGSDQLPYFYGWLHLSLTMLHNREFRPGHALVFAGPAGCGKTLIQSIITAMFGGRVGKPYQYMTGATPFNAELLEAEHLVIADEAAYKDEASRNRMASAIKQYTVEETQRCHAKGVTPIELAPLQRLTISVNDTPQSLRIVPKLTADVRDKIMLLKVQRSKVVDEKGPNRFQFRAEWEKELPGFVDAMLKWTIQPEYLDPSNPRMGIRCYQDRELLACLSEQEDYTRLLQIIDEYMFDAPHKDLEWEGRARNLEAKLLDEACPYQREANLLFKRTNACGRLLGDLQREHPDRVDSRLVQGYTVWRIRAAGYDIRMGERICGLTGAGIDTKKLKQRYEQFRWKETVKKA